MLTYMIRRLATAVPTLLFISLIIFLLLELSPADPMSQIPLTVPRDVAAKMIEALGLDGPWYERYFKWLVQFFIVEPVVFFDYVFGTNITEDWFRMRSWQHRAPVFEIIWQRVPQTLWVVGMAYIVGVLIALPIGIISAYRRYSVFDQSGTFISMIGFSVPPFFSGVLMIVIFSVNMPRESFWWFPSIYDTTLVVDSWEAFQAQVRQMLLPVMVLALQTTAQISRYMRSSMIDNLSQDYVRTARAKGLSEWSVVMVHVLRNSLIPVVTVIALGMPAIFGGAIITERVFKVNGIGDQLIGAIQASDVPTVQTLAFMFAVLIVVFNLIADLLYGLLDPRIRYE